MTTSDTIDRELSAWAARHGLHIFTKYKDDDVRTTDVVGHAGAKCQIWIEPSVDGTFVISIWNYKKKQAKRIKQLRASTDIRDKLEEAYQTAREWLI